MTATHSPILFISFAGLLMSLLLNLLGESTELWYVGFFGGFLIWTELGEVSFNFEKNGTTARCLEFLRDQFGPFYNFDDILSC